MSCIVTDAGDTFLSHSFIGRAIVVIEGIIIIIMHRRGGEEEKERCENHGKMIRRDEQPYHYCHKEGFALTKIVDESVGIKEITVVVLDRLERDLKWSLATLGVTILSPVVPYLLNVDSLSSMFIGIGTGLIAFAFGIKAFMQVKQIISGSG
jgi:hypothetical protein